MPVVTDIPPGLKEKDSQKNSPEIQLGMKTRPIQFIPAKIPKPCSQEKKTNIKLSFPSGATKTFRVFYAGGLEHASNHVRLAKSILKDLRTKAKIIVANAELKEKHQKLVLLVP